MISAPTTTTTTTTTTLWRDPPPQVLDAVDNVAALTTIPKAAPREEQEAAFVAQQEALTSLAETMLEEVVLDAPPVVVNTVTADVAVAKVSDVAGQKIRAAGAQARRELATIKRSGAQKCCSWREVCVSVCEEFRGIPPLLSLTSKVARARAKA